MTFKIISIPNNESPLILGLANIGKLSIWQKIMSRLFEQLK